MSLIPSFGKGVNHCLTMKIGGVNLEILQLVIQLCFTMSLSQPTITSSLQLKQVNTCTVIPKECVKQVNDSILKRLWPHVLALSTVIDKLQLKGKFSSVSITFYPEHLNPIGIMHMFEQFAKVKLSSCGYYR